MEHLTIGKLAKRAQVNIETIRYYERYGLIPKPPRPDSGYRQYPQEMNPGREWPLRPPPPDRTARTGQVSRSSISD